MPPTLSTPEISLLHKNGAKPRHLSSRDRRRFRHRLHLLLHRLHFHRPLVRYHVVAGFNERRHFHRRGGHVRLQLHRLRLQGSGSGSLHVHARCRGFRKPYPRDQAQGIEFTFVLHVI